MIETAITLASRLRAGLTFLYVINTAQYTGYAGSGTIMAASSLASLNEQKEAMEQHFAETIARHKDALPAQSTVERSVVEGPWVFSIIEYMNKHKPGMILLRHESHGFFEKILGDANSEIINSAEVPVWVIPEKADKAIPKKIAYITDHRQGDMEALRDVCAMAETFGAELTLLHVLEEESFKSRISREGFKAVIAEELGDCRFTHHDVMHSKMPDEVQALIGKEGIGLLAMRNESENFLTRFFTRSSVEKLMDSVEVPLAIYA
jgi:nucleotide-binding universal stress UspA family protein